MYSMYPNRSANPVALPAPAIPEQAPVTLMVVLVAVVHIVWVAHGLQWCQHHNNHLHA